MRDMGDIFEEALTLDIMGGYKPPIHLLYGEIETQIENEILKATQKVGVIVDKEELLKALLYDRGQYEKGYSAGYLKGKKETIDVLAKELLEEFTCLELHDRYPTVHHCKIILRDVVKRLRGEEHDC